MSATKIPTRATYVGKPPSRLVLTARGRRVRDVLLLVMTAVVCIVLGAGFGYELVH